MKKNVVVLMAAILLAGCGDGTPRRAVSPHPTPSAVPVAAALSAQAMSAVAGWTSGRGWSAGLVRIDGTEVAAVLRRDGAGARIVVSRPSPRMVSATVVCPGGSASVVSSASVRNGNVARDSVRSLDLSPPAVAAVCGSGSGGDFAAAVADLDRFVPSGSVRPYAP